MKPGMLSYTISIHHPSCTYQADGGRQFLVRAFVGGGLASLRLIEDVAAAVAGITKTY
jgi:hypothetical protein